MKAKSLLLTLGLLGLASLQAQTASPLPMNIKSAPKGVVTQNETQIESIVLDGKTSLKVLQMPKIFGPTYTLSLWVKLDDSPALYESKFSNEAPPTIIDLHSKDINEQRCVIRVHNGKFVITELLKGPSKWKSLNGISMKAEPGKWYHLAYSHSATQGVFYVNGDIIARTEGSPAPQDKLQNVIFGRFQSMRRMSGLIVQPRLYPVSFDIRQVRELFQNKPETIK